MNYILSDVCLTQVNNYPTRNSILDLLLTTVPDPPIDDLCSYQDVVDSDRNCLSFKLASHPTILDQFLEVFNYKKANFEELYKTLSYVPWHVAMLDNDLNSIVSNWEDLFWAAVNDFVPKKKISGRPVPRLD